MKTMLLLLALTAPGFARTPFLGWKDILFDLPDTWAREERDRTLLLYPEGKDKATGIYLVARLPKASGPQSPEVDEFFLKVLQAMGVEKTAAPETVIVDSTASSLRKWNLGGKLGPGVGYFGASVVKGEAVALMAIDSSNALQANLMDLRWILSTARLAAPAAALSPAASPAAAAKPEYELKFTRVQTRTREGRVAEEDRMEGVLTNQSQRPFKVARILIELRNKDGKAVRNYVREVKDLAPGKEATFTAFGYTLLFRDPKLFYRVEIE